MRTSWAALAVVALAIAAGCSSSPATPTSHDGKLSVVAAENFWGNLAQQVGGDHVAVTSLISNPDADPHLFEPGTGNGLAVADAAVVIVNGANYDPFMDRLLAAAPSSHRTVVRVSSVLGVTGSDPNPHLWYDAPAIPKVISAIANAFSSADPAHAAAYRAGAQRTIDRLQPLEQAVTQLRRDDAGVPVAYTERVPGLLLNAAGLRVLTPPGFAHSIESGTDPSFADIASMRDLITQHKIKALLLNAQAETAATDQIESLARANAIPIVPVTETMPLSDSFESWQLGQINALIAALQR